MKTLTINQINGSYSFAKEAEFAAYPVTKAQAVSVNGVRINIIPSEVSYPSGQIQDKSFMMTDYINEDLNNADKLWSATTTSLIKSQYDNIMGVVSLEKEKFQELLAEQDVAPKNTQWLKRKAKETVGWRIRLGQPEVIVLKSLDASQKKTVNFIKYCLRNNIDVELHCRTHGHYIFNHIDWSQALKGKGKGRFERTLPWALPIQSEPFATYEECIKATEKFTSFVHQVERRAELLLNTEMAQFNTDIVGTKKARSTEFIYSMVHQEFGEVLAHTYGEMRPSEYVWEKIVQPNIKELLIWAPAFGIDVVLQNPLNITPGAYRVVRPDVYSVERHFINSFGDLRSVETEVNRIPDPRENSAYDGTKEDSNYVLRDFNSLQRQELQAAASRRHNLRNYDSQLQVFEKLIQVQYYLACIKEGHDAADFLDDHYDICPNCGKPYQKMQHHCSYCKFQDGQALQNVILAKYMGLEVDAAGRLIGDYELSESDRKRLFPVPSTVQTIKGHPSKGYYDWTPDEI